MMSPTLCSRHGVQPFTLASGRVAECAGNRERFAPGELVRVSLDRPKRSKLAWMTQADLDEQGADARRVDGLAHVTSFPVIAALERTWVPICPACLDELLVRSGEQPHAPTPVERAFDMSAIADNAVMDPRFMRCDQHGIVSSRPVSPSIAAAVDGKGAAGEPPRPVRVVVALPRAENVGWYDEVHLRALFGPAIDLSSGTLRMDAGPDSERLYDAGVRVCGRCLSDWLKQQGIEA